VLGSEGNIWALRSSLENGRERGRGWIITFIGRNVARSAEGSAGKLYGGPVA